MNTNKSELAPPAKPSQPLEALSRGSRIISMASVLMRFISKSYIASTSADYAQRVSSSWILPPWILFSLRAIISLYAFVVLFIRLGLEIATTAQQSFSYFTILGYWGLAFYFAFAAAHTASYAARGRPWLEAWPAWLRYLHSAFYMTVTVYPFVVTAVFWGVLSAGALATELSTWANISEHALNSVFAFLEILLPRSDPHPWIQVVPLVIVLALYLGIAYLSHTTEHFYVYSFLNPANGRGLVAGACIGILVGSIIVFVIVRCLILFRRWLTEKKLGLGQQKQRGYEMASFKPSDNGIDNVAPSTRNGYGADQA